MRQERVVFGYCSRGADVNCRMPFYVLEQEKRFEHFSVCCMMSGAFANWEGVFEEVINTGFEYCHVTDSDVVLSPETTEKLIDSGKDVVISPVWHYNEAQNDIHLNVHYNGHADCQQRMITPKAYGVEPIHSGSFASLLVTRDVLIKLKGAGKDFFFYNVPSKDENGEVWMPDNAFFADVCEIGVTPYVCWDAGTGEHIKNIRLNSQLIGNLIRRVVQEAPKKERVNEPASC